MDTLRRPIERWVGINVSKATLDVMVLPERTYLQVPNTVVGWQRLIRQLGAVRPARIVLEPTGSYHVGLMVALDAAGLTPAVINPRWIRDFAESLGKRGKTDRIDALVLALYAQRMNPPPRPVPAAPTRQLQAVIARRADLVKLRTMERNRRHTIDPLLLASVDETIAYLGTQITTLDHLIVTLVAADECLKARVAQLQSAPGIGPLIGPLLAARLPELGTITRQEVASLAGLAPFAKESGTKRGRRFVLAGRADVTIALYQAMTTACTRHPVLKARYRHLPDDLQKPHKVAIIACARWLLSILVVMLREGLTWEQTRAAQTARVCAPSPLG